MELTIPKYQSVFQYLAYTRLFRAPGWLFQKLLHSRLDGARSLRLRMRLGHRIELVPAQPYLKRVVWNRAYHDDGVFYIEPFLSSGAVILDIGANIGLLTCAYAERFKHLSPKIYAIEAVSKNFEALKKNIELNGFTNVSPFRLALGKERGELSFSLPSKDFVGNAVGSNVLCEEDWRNMDSNSYVEKVPMVTLDEWSREQQLERCDFLKIDVEGAELTVFQGGRDFISRTKPIIQCEFNRYWLENQGVGINELLSFFRPLGYGCFVDAGNRFVPLDEKKFDEALVDLLFIPEGKGLRR